MIAAAAVIGFAVPAPAQDDYTAPLTELIAQAVRLMQDEGMTATVSSIHINGWYGAHNKWDGACWIVRELFQRDPRRPT